MTPEMGYRMKKESKEQFLKRIQPMLDSDETLSSEDAERFHREIEAAWINQGDSRKSPGKK